MEEITNYINDQQLSEYLNVEENENPKPVSSSKKSSFQSLIREVVLCHMREIEDTKESCRKKGAEVLVKRYKAVKEEKLNLKSKVEYWSDECKKLQYENSKLLSFLKNGLCTKCDNHMKMVCGNNEFSRQPGRSPEATASKDRSADEGGVSLIEGVHPSEDRSMSSDSHGTDDTSQTSVKLRKSPTTTLQKASPPSKRESKRESRGSSGAQSISGQSTPSPSVLSGNIPKFNISEKKIGDSSPNLKARRSRQTEDIIEIDADVGAENAGSPSSSKHLDHSDSDSDSDSVESLPDLYVPPQNSARIPLKEVLISVQSKANGSIDPHAHLSQYETVPDDYADNVLPTLRPSRRSRDKTPKSPQEETQYCLDSDSLDMTCQSVVFGPPKVQGTKLSNPRDENDVKAAHGSPEKVIYVPETMDVDLDSGYEDAVNNLGGFAVATPGGNTKDAETPKGPGKPEDSFDFVQKDEGPDYAYAEVVRKRSEREQLKGYPCPECKPYFNADGAAGDNLKFCRHKARHVPPSTPEHFWDLTLPDTQVAQERGYMNITQGKASKFRRKRKLNKLFKSKDESGSEEYEDDI